MLLSTELNIYDNQYTINILYYIIVNRTKHTIINILLIYCTRHRTCGYVIHDVRYACMFNKLHNDVYYYC